MGVKTYNFKEVILIIEGNHITGFADGTSITVERNSDAFTYQKNVDGGGTRSQSNDKSGRITFSLAQSAGANAILSAIAQLDELTAAGTFVVLVKDNQGRSLHTCETGWIVKAPNAEYGMESAAREWIIETDNLIHFVGGN